MAIDRKLWRKHYTHFSGFLCPSCNKNRLVEDKAQEKLNEPEFSKRVHNEIWWEPEMISYRFASTLVCPQKSCGEIVTIIGNAGVDQGYLDGPSGYEVEYFEIYKPTAAHPAPTIFVVQDNVDQNVREAIVAAFSLIWIESSSCLNAIRRCVELIMDNAGIARTTIDKNSKRVTLALHSRINKYQKKNAEVAEILMALKWLGNVGSHVAKTDPGLDTVLDAFEILELAIEELYSTKRKEIQKKIKSINKRKGK